MSYKTNFKSLRTGITQSWNYKAHGPEKNFHLENKIKQYIQNIIEYAIPPAPKNVKTKKNKERKFPIQPGLQGRTYALRTGNKLCILSFCYISLDGATKNQIDNLEQNIIQLWWLIHKETGYGVTIRIANIFTFFWRFETFLGINVPGRVEAQINRCIEKFDWLVVERSHYMLIKKNILRIKRNVPIWMQRQLYFRRSFYPLLSAFIFFDFDSAMAAKAIAFELQTLRIQHKQFLRYVKKVFMSSFKIWHKYNTIDGIQITINGRLTNFRRQSRRTETRRITIGEKIRRSHLGYSGTHDAALAYNRYGTISVQVDAQLKPIIKERVEERSPYTPHKLFSISAMVEKCYHLWDFNPQTGQQDKTPTRRRVQKDTGRGCTDTQYEKISKRCVIHKKNLFSRAEIKTQEPEYVSLKLVYANKFIGTETPYRSWIEKNTFRHFRQKIKTQKHN